MNRQAWQMLAFAVVLASTGWSQVTQRVSVATGGGQGNGISQSPSISADGRFVAFSSFASDLVSGDTNGTSDVFVRDRLLGTTERVSVDSAGMQGNNSSDWASITADGRYVAFESVATNLVPGDTNGSGDVFVHDRLAGTTIRVSVASGGAQGNGYSSFPSISGDGRYVAFSTSATNLFPGDTNVADDVVVHDLLLNRTELVSLAASGAYGNSHSQFPSISGDGRCVAFESQAYNLVPGDTNGGWDVFVRDRLSGTTERASVASNGAQAYADPLDPDNCSISADGRFVAFDSRSSNLVPGDTNANFDVFVHDRLTGTTERVSIDSGGGQGNGISGTPSISHDGRYVAFSSTASNLVPGDTNTTWDIFVHDRATGTTERVSVSTAGVQANAESDEFPSINADGRYVAFWDRASNLVPGDSNGLEDVFVHDRSAEGFTSLCEPGVQGVMSCPCSNPPSVRDRGCDNSSATGGANLSASGIAYLSIDGLVFTTSGELPTAFSILMQGNTLLTNGVVYGQGVRCVGGATKRLYTKTAVAGSITAPDFGVGDPTVSARSAAKGDVIQPGQSRWYLVYYRDPNVLGGCPASSTFNATQTGQVTWWP